MIAWQELQIEERIPALTHQLMIIELERVAPDLAREYLRSLENDPTLTDVQIAQVKAQVSDLLARKSIAGEIKSSGALRLEATRLATLDLDSLKQELLQLQHSRHRG